MIFDDVYIIIELCIFDFAKFVYYANDASICLAYFLCKKWPKFLNSWRRYYKFFQNLRAKLVILKNFWAGKLLPHIDLEDYWRHQQLLATAERSF